MRNTRQRDDVSRQGTQPPNDAPADTPTQPTARIETEVTRLRALLEQGQFSSAVADAKALLAEVPENRDLWYVVAVSQRYLQRIADALSTLAQLERLHPDYSRLYQERGHCYVALREAPPAIEAFLRAVNINPALPASWNALKILFKMTGQTADDDMAAAHVDRLADLPPEVVTASTLFAAGEVAPPARLAPASLLTPRNHVQAVPPPAKIRLQLAD